MFSGVFIRWTDEKSPMFLCDLMTLNICDMLHCALEKFLPSLNSSTYPFLTNQVFTVDVLKGRNFGREAGVAMHWRRTLVINVHCIMSYPGVLYGCLLKSEGTISSTPNVTDVIPYSAKKYVYDDSGSCDWEWSGIVYRTSNMSPSVLLFTGISSG